MPLSEVTVLGTLVRMSTRASSREVSAATTISPRQKLEEGEPTCTCRSIRESRWREPLERAVGGRADVHLPREVVTRAG